MGQVYSVSLKVQFKDKKGAAKALRSKINRAKAEFVEYNLDHYEALGIGAKKIEDLLKIFFGGWYGRLQDTGATLESGFDASYGWEGVMIDAFDLMAPFLEDGSWIRIYPDSGCDHGIITNGKVNWVS